MAPDDADEPFAPSFYWTKVWGRPREPSGEALLFRDEKTRDDRFNNLSPGDIVVYLTSEVAQADPMIKGHVAGAVEIAGDKVNVEDLESSRGRGRRISARTGASAGPTGSRSVAPGARSTRSRTPT